MKHKKTVFFFVDQFLSVLGMAVILFWSSGHIDWWPAWSAMGIWLLFFCISDFLLWTSDPDLLVERISPPGGAKSWDKTLMGLLRLAQLIRYLLAGFDQRFNWIGNFSLNMQIFGLVASVMGYALLTWAMYANTFFSRIVRLQFDRNHHVVTQGPYRYLRHPAYSGMILFELAISIMLDSYWACMAGGLCALILVIRTIFEDRLLQRELPGYLEYSQMVKFRLLPGIW